jgi:hypothetical protein
MSTKTIVIALAVIVVGGAVWWMSHDRRDIPSDANVVVGEEQTGTDAGPLMEDGSNDSGKKMAFSSFVAQGGAYECTVNQSVQGVDSTGTVYVDGGKMSGMFSTSIQGMKIDNMFIAKDGYSYTWSSSLPGQGFKVAVATPTGTNASVSASGTYAWNADQIGDYDCKPWTADQSKFAIPASIKFTEMKQ